MAVKINVELLVLHIATPTARWTVVNLVKVVPVAVILTVLIHVVTIVLVPLLLV